MHFFIDVTHTDSLVSEIARTADWELTALVEQEARFLFEAALQAHLLGLPLSIEAAFLNN